jgi:hypothetical protein
MKNEKLHYTHPAWKNIPKQDWEFLTNGISKYNTFNGRIVRYGEHIREGKQKYGSRKGITDLLKQGDEAVGDIWEAVAGEHFLKYFGPALGIYDYEIEKEHDWGIDGKGKGSNNEIKPVQLKFRSDGQTTLTHKSGLDGFVEEAIWKYKINPSSKNAVLIITNAKNVLWKDCIQRWNGFVSYIAPNESWGLYTDKKYKSSEAIRSLSLRQLVDNELPFWDKLQTFISTLS